MKDFVRKTLLSGIGVMTLAKEKIEAAVGELVEKGEMSEREGRDLLEELKHRSEETRKHLEEKIDTQVRKVIDKMGLAKKDDLDRLAARIEQLEQVLRDREQLETGE